MATEVVATDKILLLKKIEMFEGLTVAELAAVGSVTEEVKYAPGEMVIKRGDMGETMPTIFMLLETQLDRRLPKIICSLSPRHPYVRRLEGPPSEEQQQSVARETGRRIVLTRVHRSPKVYWFAPRGLLGSSRCDPYIGLTLPSGSNRIVPISIRKEE